MRWLIISLLALIVSFSFLGSLPAGFDGDEAAFGYYGYSLIKTGADEFGNKLPLYFKSIGDYKYPLYAYLTTIPVGLFGLSVFSARAIAALSGVALILLMSKIAKDNKIFSYLAILIAIFSPWYLVFFRAAKEAGLGLALFLSAVYLFKNKKYWWLSLVLFVLAGLSYSAYRVFGIMMVIILWWFNRKEKQVNKKGLIITVCTILILGILSLNPLSRSRANGLLFTTDNNLWDQAQSQRWEIGMKIPGQTGALIAKVFDNKIAVMAFGFGQRYLAHFDLNYLFFLGNPNLAWYAVPRMGQLLLIALPLILLGLLEIAKRREDYWNQIFIFWLILSPIPSALTVEAPNPIRNLLTFPAFIFLILLGLKNVKWGKFWLAILILINIAFSIKQYSIHREYHQPWYTNQGLPEVVKYALANKNNYENVVVSGDPYIFFLFFGAKDNNWSAKSIKTNNSQWDSVAQIDNIIFLMPMNCPKVGKENVLYICKGTEVPQNSDVKYVSYYKDGLPAYTAVEFKKLAEMTKPLPSLSSRLTYMVEVDHRDEGVIPANQDRFW